MRKLVYEVEGNGNLFSTASYKVAKMPGNKILKTYLVPVEELTPEQKEETEKLRNKRIAARKAKKA